jgi:hypothetical protein
MTEIENSLFWKRNHSCLAETPSGTSLGQGIGSIQMDAAQTVQPKQDTGNQQAKISESTTRTDQLA